MNKTGYTPITPTDSFAFKEKEMIKIKFIHDDNNEWRDNYFVAKASQDRYEVCKANGDETEVVMDLKPHLGMVLEYLVKNQGKNKSAYDIAEELKKTYEKFCHKDDKFEDNRQVHRYIDQLRNIEIDVDIDNKTKRETLFDIQPPDRGSKGYIFKARIEEVDSINWSSQHKSFSIRYKAYRFNKKEINKYLSDEKEKDKLKTALSLLAYLRTESGALTLADMGEEQSEEDNIIESINTLFGKLKLLSIQDSYNENPRFNKLVTSYENRAFIDLLLDMFIVGESVFFNPILYSESITFDKNEITKENGFSKISVSFPIPVEIINRIESQYDEVDKDKRKILEEVCKKLKNCEKKYNLASEQGVKTSYTDCILFSDDVDAIFSANSFDKIKFKGCIVDSELIIKDSKIGSIDMTGTVFKKPFSILSSLFDDKYFPDSEQPKYLFRETRFEDNVYLINNTFKSNDMYITFEDACFVGNKDNNELVFRRNAFSVNTKLDFFETRFLNYRVEISESDLSHLSVCMNGATLYNQLDIVNAGNISDADFEFRIGNRFDLANSVLTGILKTKNIVQLDLFNIALTSGYIASSRDWDYEENKNKIPDLSKAGTQNSDISLCTSIVHPLLKACANNKKQLLLIRECFQRSFDEVSKEEADKLYKLFESKNELPKETIQIEDVSIISAKQNDYDAIRTLAQQCTPLDVHTSYSYYVLLSYFSDICYIAYYKDNPIGFVSGIVRNSNGFIWQIGVLPQYRNNGIASLLLKEIFHKYEEIDIKSVELTIDEHNKASLALFTKYSKNSNLVMNQDLGNSKYKSEILYRIEMN